jgi:hypothetical protein
MNFHKEEYIANHKEIDCKILFDFLEVEISVTSYKYIYFLLDLPNIKSFLYEGNEYYIEEKKGIDQIIITDYICKAHGIVDANTTIHIKKTDLIELLKWYKQYLEERGKW